MKLSKPTMSVLTLVMINVIAIDSLRNISMGATFGFSLLFFYILYGLIFFIPSALVSAELSTGWPQTGGMYVWVREAFGVPAAFVAVWMQWIYNICWYPTILSFLAGVLAYLINPALAENVWYILGVVFVTYWLITAITLRGIHLSGLLSTITAIVGVILPLTTIIVLGAMWVLKGNPINMDISWNSFIPKMKNPGDIVLLTAVVYGLIGMEVSATHAQDVKNPQRDYPRALCYSTIIILLSLVLSSLAVAIVVPAEQLNLVTALPDAFKLFFQEFHLVWVMPIIVLMIVLGTAGSVAAWVIGPSRCLLVAAKDGCIPPFLQKVNSKQMPIAVLIVQGIVFSIISLVFLIMPTVNSSFWMLSDLTALLAVSCYIFIFAAAIRLRYKHPKVKRAYRVPFGNVGMWVVCILGITASVATVLIGFIPPTKVRVGNVWFYEFFLITGFIGFYLIPLLIYKMRKRSWLNKIDS